MSKNNSIKPEFEIKLDNEGILARQKTSHSSEGLYFFEDKLKINSTLATTVITCSGWLIEFFELRSGKISLTNSTQEIHPQNNHFGIIYPPFSITRPCFKDVEGNLRGIAGTLELPVKFAKHPSIFETNLAESPQNIEQIIVILNSSQNVQTIEINPKASLLSLKAKKLIDENYLIYPSIARIANRLSVSHEHLTRQFKQDFLMTPNYYLHQLRLADANFRLAKGEKIINVSNEVGYNDLSRFYKQFRKSNAQSPGGCQNILRPKQTEK